MTLEIAWTGRSSATDPTWSSVSSAPTDEVALRQQHHRLRAALAGENDVPLDSSEIQILVERGDDEDDVDVRGEHLLLGRLPGGLARELRPAGDERDDRSRLLVLARGHGDPVADHREVGRRRRLVVQTAGDVATEVPELREDVVGAAVWHRYPARDRAGRRDGGELLRECLVPA